MKKNNIKAVFDKLKYGEDAFQELMRWRIRRVLLVLPHYDAWILEHDAKLSDQIVGEYHQLNLTTVPRLITVSDGEEALEMLEKQSFDLMITGVRVGELSTGDLVEKAKKLQKDLAVLMLLSSRSDLSALEANHSQSDGMIDARFLWTGDSRLFLAMIKYVEDWKNAPGDTEDGRVGVLMVVEDSIPFYSAYLPLLYGEIMTQTQRLIAEEMNDSDKYWRMRTRPKVLLARNWEEAVKLGDRYKKALIGIVSDIAFSRDGRIDGRAGFSLIEHLREIDVHVPVLFQSSDDSLASDASERGARFQGKLSGDLHRGIRRFILEELGFGDFVFCSPQGRELKRVRTLRDFELAIGSLPVESILYHAERDDYSRWMAAHGEYQVARRIKPVCSEDFSTPEAHREFLVHSFREVRENRHRGRLLDFRFDNPGAPGSMGRYGSGSLGGKGRGLAFFNALLNTSPWEDHFSPLRIGIPQTLIIATGEFDAFLEKGDLPPNNPVDDETLRRAFLDTEFPEYLMEVLRTFSESEPGPLAVRSSALLEDSQSIPFAGVYDTYMIPDVLDGEERMLLLADAVRLVWASTYSKEATAYRDSLGVGREEEKMAVIIQQVTGSRHDGYWFPRLSGTAQSLNYYPVGPMDREDGAARIAIGLGRSIVEGGRGFLFSPRYPAVPWGTEEDRWREGQTHFWVLETKSRGARLISGESSTLKQLTIRDAEKLGVLLHMVSTWDSVGHRLVDGIDIPGPRVVDFKDILGYEWLPLSSLLDQLLKIARSAMGIPVELEFSLDWEGDFPGDAVFSLLQVRPLVSQVGPLAAVPERPEDSRLLLRSGKSLGHGVIEGIHDVIWVDPDLYNPGYTESLRDEIAAVMDELAQDNRHAILIGPGRWGSRDRFLGIPVSWSQVRQARLIVEVSRGFGDPEPSQGSHFFHNLVALGVGYAYVTSSSDDFVDWNFLREKSSGRGAVRSARLDHALELVMDGKNGLIWVTK